MTAIYKFLITGGEDDSGKGVVSDCKLYGQGHWQGYNSFEAQIHWSGWQFWVNEKMVKYIILYHII